MHYKNKKQKGLNTSNMLENHEKKNIHWWTYVPQNKRYEENMNQKKNVMKTYTTSYNKNQQSKYMLLDKIHFKNLLQLQIGDEEISFLTLCFQSSKQDQFINKTNLIESKFL